ncbi:hypothetical protein PPL_12609 [Heterostelium album PN500]|uniref:Tubulin-tyrosine ligase n=1 Tax=Heterostelium pallidum (strain ATCC 26659 / Pp 5 / PN500) TaxID=670386 RepID=D3BN32_HETP5|nr:hypothetical protein PPL_12609 [Heterostelium album PN500]EFA77394.1 hypothetical protein PPL_12609 [Heterostelium album PN500]|eukprot:XP_020429523.1 hypothetical protein PPL_12609 [Heterostelium album PN500]
MTVSNNKSFNNQADPLSLNNTFECNNNFKRYSTVLKNVDLNDESKLIELYGKCNLKYVVIISKSSKYIPWVPEPGQEKDNELMNEDELFALKWKRRRLLNEVLEERSFQFVSTINEEYDLRFKNTNIDLVWLKILLSVTEKEDFPNDLYCRFDQLHNINRFPQMPYEINAKHSLARNIKSMADRFGEKEFSFHPKTFILPEEFQSLNQYSKENPNVQFIMKPKFGGKGIGIHLYSNSNEIENDSNYVVQEYLANPFLIDGKKFTLRLYVLITSLDPLIFYIHNNGVLKFATSDFTIDRKTFNDDNMSKHVTNQTININLPTYKFSTDLSVDDIGSKWSLKAFWRYLDKNKIYPSTLLWGNIKDVVAKTIFSVELAVLSKTNELMKSESNGFQLLGLDIDLLDNFQPIFLEANVNPQLGSAKPPFDNYNKLLLIRETFDLIGHTVYNSTTMKEDIKSKLLQQKSDIFVDQSENIKQFDQSSLDKLVQFEFENIHHANYELIYPTKESIDSLSKYHLNKESNLNQMLHRYVKSDAKDY